MTREAEDPLLTALETALTETPAQDENHYPQLSVVLSGHDIEDNDGTLADAYAVSLACKAPVYVRLDTVKHALGAAFYAGQLSTPHIDCAIAERAHHQTLRELRAVREEGERRRAELVARAEKAEAEVTALKARVQVLSEALEECRAQASDVDHQGIRETVNDALGDLDDENDDDG